MFESGGKAPKIGCDPKQIDWLAYRRSRVGIFNSSFFDTMGVQEYNDFEKYIFIVLQIFEDVEFFLKTLIEN